MTQAHIWPKFTHMNVVDLQGFYSSPLGKATHRLLHPKIVPALKLGVDARVLGLGYATPYLQPVSGAMAFMLARRGVMHWPTSGVVQSALVDEYDLPLPDHSIDVAVVIHGLEFTDDADEMLQELWRVLAPQGTLILVVPNRHGLWSLSDSSPFGFGQPFSSLQLTRLLKTAQFSLDQMNYGLFMPPWLNLGGLRMAPVVEKLGAATLGQLSGVLIASATKHIFAYSSGKRLPRSALRLRPALLGSPRKDFKG